MKSIVRACVVVLFLQTALSAQSLNDIRNNLTSLSKVSSVTGHEQPIVDLIVTQLKQQGFSPQIDPMSNVTVTLGSGKPHRLLIANLDEPGFIVSGITEDGYLRMQRIGTVKPHAYFDQYFEGQRLAIRTSNGTMLTGVLAIPSTHLARGTNRSERPFDLTDAYVDVGVKSAAEVNELGIRILDPIAIEKGMTNLAHDHVTGPFLSDRAGAAILMSILTTMPKNRINGTVTFAFTTQEHFGRKGLDRMTVLFDPDEVYVLEPLNNTQITQNPPVSIDVQAAPAAPAVRKMLERFDGIREATLQQVPQSPQWKRGTDVIRIGIPVLFYATPVEVLDLNHLQSALRFLQTIVQSGVS